MHCSSSDISECMSRLTDFLTDIKNDLGWFWKDGGERGGRPRGECEILEKERLLLKH